MGHGMRTNGTCNWSGKKYTSTEIKNNIQTKKKPIGLKKKHEEGMVDGFTQICRTAQELTSVQISSNEVLNPTQQLCPAYNSYSLHTDPNIPTFLLPRQERSLMDHMHLQGFSLPYWGQKIWWKYVVIRLQTKLR